MKAQRKRNRGDGRDRRRVSVAWLLLAVLVTAALAVGACALLLPDRPPALLGQAAEMTSAPASVQEYSGQQQVTVVPSMSAKRDLVGNASGTVTADWSAGGLNSGKGAYRVNDRTVVALATASPLYRDLATNDTGEDVRALNDELNRLGYRSSPGSDRYTWATSAGWKQLMADNGNSSDGNLLVADTLWIPAASVAVGNWQAAVGAPVSAASPVGEVPGSLVKLAVKNGQPSDHDRQLTALGQTTTLPAGQIEVTDAAFLAQVAATPDFQSMDENARAAGFDATLTLQEPVTVLRVPAGAVFGIRNTSGCIVALGSGGKAGAGASAGSDGKAGASGRVVKVNIVGSELGVSLVTPADGADPSSISTVAIGSALSGRSCR